MPPETTAPSAQPPDRPRVLSGMRPTGRLHLGNYMGALYNWVNLQNQRDPVTGQPLYDCFFFIADWHALTTDYADPSQLKQNVFEIALDFLAAGLDPERSTIFIQSHVPQHAELHLLLSMITPISWLERVPTYKDQQEQLKEKDLATYGFLGYPLLQSADILLYSPPPSEEATSASRKLFVPVGADQVAHVEITREIARRFNHLYGNHPFEGIGSPSAIASLPRGELDTSTSPLVEPDVILTPSPKLLGTDGRKMSKSYGNSILLTDEDSVVFQKLRGMSTNGQRIRQADPGDPELCPVGDLHRVFSAPEKDAQIRQDCREAASYCVDCKRAAAESVLSSTRPIRAKRAELEKYADRVWHTLEVGTRQAAAAGENTMNHLRTLTGLSRDRSGVRSETNSLNEDQDVPVRDFSAVADWQNMSGEGISQKLYATWYDRVRPLNVELKESDNGLRITRNNRRVLTIGTAGTLTIGTAGTLEGPIKDIWKFSTKPRSADVLILLCLDWNRTVHDFVIPQKLIVAPWTAAKKAAGKNDLVFTVTYDGDTYYLNLPDASPIDLTGTEAAYKIISD